MLFRTKKLTPKISLVYGFRKEDDKHFCLITTLQEKQEDTIAHGLLTKGEMSFFEFMDLWKYFKQTLKTKFLVCDVVPEHARVYKLGLPVISSYKSKTFNGLACEVLKIKITGKLKNFHV